MVFFSADNASHLLHQYGEIGLFVLLAVGIFGLPIPDETLLVLAGYLAAHDHLNVLALFLAAWLGSICGISLSYTLGRLLEHSVLLRYGKYIGITQPRLEKAHCWFERYGKWLLTFGYYIPGIRHFTGIVAGISYLRYRDFALFAYSGALLWALSFISLGYFFFEQWQSVLNGLSSIF